MLTAAAAERHVAPLLLLLLLLHFKLLLPCDSSNPSAQ
jgi:hypothetical protein